MLIVSKKRNANVSVMNYEFPFTKFAVSEKKQTFWLGETAGFAIKIARSESKDVNRDTTSTGVCKLAVDNVAHWRHPLVRGQAL